MAHPLERVYPYMPVWAQNLGITLYGYAYRGERLGGDFDLYVRGFQERERWPESRMTEYLTSQLRQVLTRAFEFVPYYRGKWRAKGIRRADLENFELSGLPTLPVTPKPDLRQEPDAFVAQDIPTRKLHRYHSSGSTGTPVTGICTSEGHRRFFAAREARSFNWAGASIRWPRSMIGGRMVVHRADASPPYFRYNYAERQVYFTAYHISPATAANYLEGLNRYRPRVLTGYAYSHYLLARYMLDRDLRLTYTPDALVLGSEKLTPVMKETIRQAFGARAFEEYGAVEQCLLATECEQGSLHANQDFGIVEIVDESGEPVPPGVEGRILCTGLLNEAQPLIRYDIGDVGIWSAKSCPCGRNQLPVLQEMVGRLEDVVVGPDGREMVRFHGLFIHLPHVLEGQVIQEKLDFFRILVVATDDFNEEDEQTLRRRLTEERLGNVRVQVERVSELQRTERGKFRAVISKVTPEERHTVLQRSASMY